jgi:hypothetical protein
MQTPDNGTDRVGGMASGPSSDWRRKTAPSKTFPICCVPIPAPLPVRRCSKRVRPREGNPQSPEKLTALTEKMHPAHAAIAWSMALTGMLPHELWGQWTQYGYHYIHIHGTKRQGRKRDIPSIRPIERPGRLYRPFLEALKDASGGAVLPKDLRNTFSNWLQKASVPRVRRKIYYGHGKTDVSDIYEWEEVQEFLRTDGDRVRKYLEDHGIKPTLRLHSKETLSA